MYPWSWSPPLFKTPGKRLGSEMATLKSGGKPPHSKGTRRVPPALSSRKSSAIVEREPVSFARTQYRELFDRPHGTLSFSSANRPLPCLVSAGDRLALCRLRAGPAPRVSLGARRRRIRLRRTVDPARRAALQARLQHETARNLPCLCRPDGRLWADYRGHPPGTAGREPGHDRPVVPLRARAFRSRLGRHGGCGLRDPVGQSVRVGHGGPRHAFRRVLRPGGRLCALAAPAIGPMVAGLRRRPALGNRLPHETARRVPDDLRRRIPLVAGIEARTLSAQEAARGLGAAIRLPPCCPTR